MMRKKIVHYHGGSTVLKTRGHLHKSKRSVKGGVGYFAGQALEIPAEFEGKVYGIRKQEVEAAEKPKPTFSKRVLKQTRAAKGKKPRSYKGDDSLVPAKVKVSKIKIKAAGSFNFVVERKSKKLV